MDDIRYEKTADTAHYYITKQERFILACLGIALIVGCLFTLSLGKTSQLRLEAGQPPDYAAWQTQLERSRQVYVNKASVDELTRLPGVGRAMAERIAEYRRSHGPFKRVDELRHVSGIGRKKYMAIKPYVKVD